jgi:hypothetical protein
MNTAEPTTANAPPDEKQGSDMKTSVSVVLTWLTIVFLLLWGTHGAFLAYSVPISLGSEPAWLAGLDSLLVRANALPEDLSRSVGHAFFGASVAALAIGNPAFGTRARVIAVVLLLLAAIGAWVGLTFLAPTPALSDQVIGGKPLLDLATGMCRKTLELSLTLLSALLGLALFQEKKA